MVISANIEEPRDRPFLSGRIKKLIARQRGAAVLSTSGQDFAVGQQGGSVETTAHVERAVRSPGTGCRVITFRAVGHAAGRIATGKEHLSIGQQRRSMESASDI